VDFPTGRSEEGLRLISVCPAWHIHLQGSLQHQEGVDGSRSMCWRRPRGTSGQLTAHGPSESPCQGPFSIPFLSLSILGDGSAAFWDSSVPCPGCVLPCSYSHRRSPVGAGGRAQACALATVSLWLHLPGPLSSLIQKAFFGGLKSALLSCGLFLRSREGWGGGAGGGVGVGTSEKTRTLQHPFILLTGTHHCA
jgi:hypothetical protein